MHSPIQTINQEKRLQTLASFQILDSLPESDYDNITKIAAELCQTQIALITFLDRDRQWFKSAEGIDVEETPIKDSFCIHTINHHSDILIVEDTRIDNRFCDNPFVTGAPNVIFYAGVPLITSEGTPIGALCVIDDETKQLTTQQIFYLKVLSKQVVNLLELRRNKVFLENSNKELLQKNKELEQFNFISSHDMQKLDSVGQKSLSFILEASKRMSGLLQDLLNYSVVGHQCQLVEVDTQLIVQNILEDFHLVIEEKQASIQFENLPKIHAYESEFRLLLQNLISNAIRDWDRTCHVQKNNLFT